MADPILSRNITIIVLSVLLFIFIIIVIVLAAKKSKSASSPDPVVTNDCTECAEDVATISCTSTGCDINYPTNNNSLTLTPSTVPYSTPTYIVSLGCLDCNSDESANVIFPTLSQLRSIYPFVDIANDKDLSLIASNGASNFDNNSWYLNTDIASAPLGFQVGAVYPNNFLPNNNSTSTYIWVKIPTMDSVETLTKNLQKFYSSLEQPFFLFL